VSHKRVLDGVEVEAVLGTFSKAPTSVRNRALVETMWRAGLRISEALDLMAADLDPQAGTLRVRDGKGGVERTVAMGPMAWEDLRAWLRVRRPRGVPSGAPIFCALRRATQAAICQGNA
jgi:integrase/recombinase XerD